MEDGMDTTAANEWLNLGLACLCVLTVVLVIVAMAHHFAPANDTSHRTVTCVRPVPS